MKITHRHSFVASCLTYGVHFTSAKAKVTIKRVKKNKFWSSECKKNVFYLPSRDKIV